MSATIDTLNRLIASLEPCLWNHNLCDLIHRSGSHSTAASKALRAALLPHISALERVRRMPLGHVLSALNSLPRDSPLRLNSCEGLPEAVEATTWTLRELKERILATPKSWPFLNTSIRSFCELPVDAVGRDIDLQRHLALLPPSDCCIEQLCWDVLYDISHTGDSRLDGLGLPRPDAPIFRSPTWTPEDMRGDLWALSPRPPWTLEKVRVYLEPPERLHPHLLVFVGKEGLDRRDEILSAWRWTDHGDAPVTVAATLGTFDVLTILVTCDVGFTDDSQDSEWGSSECEIWGSSCGWVA